MFIAKRSPWLGPCRGSPDLSTKSWSCCMRTSMAWQSDEGEDERRTKRTTKKPIFMAMLMEFDGHSMEFDGHSMELNGIEGWILDGFSLWFWDIAMNWWSVAYHKWCFSIATLNHPKNLLLRSTNPFKAWNMKTLEDIGNPTVLRVSSGAPKQCLKLQTKRSKR